MKPQLYILLFFFTVSAGIATAQRQNNIWFWAGNNVLNFNTEKPSASISDNPIPSSGSASVCDVNGSLLFYTDRTNVYDKLHRIMPNGDNIEPFMQPSSQYTWEPLIIPFVNDPDKYYVFTTHGKSDSILYSIVDMSLNGGYGDIIENQKSVKLVNSVPVGFLRTIQGNGCFVWLLTHALNENTFYVYKIDENGIHSEPVISKSGFFDGSYSYSNCRVSISNDNSKIALSIASYSLELHLFNNETGIVSNAQLPVQYGFSGRIHSTCFSPDDSKLYITGGPDGDGLIQLNMNSLPNIDTVDLFDTTNNINGQLRMGPDNKIYISDWHGLYTILYPNRQGNACSLITNYIQLPLGAKCYPHSLGNNVTGKPLIKYSRIVDTTVCVDSLILTGPEGMDSYLWHDGDTNNVKLINESGKVWLSYKKSCYLTTDTFNVKFTKCNCNPFLPNAFTPNRDGINDRFGLGGDDIADAYLTIYDRWGKQLFSSNDPLTKWDGKYNGLFCDIGTYFYYCKVKCFNGQEKVLKGDLLLLR